MKPATQMIHTINSENSQASLPEGWTSCDLGDHVYIAGRIGWRGLKAEEYTASGPLLLSVPNLNYGDTVDFSKVSYISQVRYDESPEIKLREGDTLLVKDGAGIGKLGFVEGLPAAATVNSSLLVVRPDSDLLVNKYLFYYLKGPHFQQLALQRITGSATPHLFQKDIKLFCVLIPPPAEQRRIVHKLEGCLSAVYATCDHLSRVPLTLKRFRQAVLASAFSGRLTEDWRETHPEEGSGTLLRRSIATKRIVAWESAQSARHRKRRYFEPIPLEEADLPEIPQTWTWVSADEVCSQITDGEHIQPRYKSAGLPMITATHVRDGFVEFKNVGLISEEDFARCLERCAPTKDDILIVSVGATTGRAAIVPQCQPFAMVRSVLMLRPLIEPKFLLRWTQSRWCQIWISQASGASAQPHFYIHDNRRMPVPLPPTSEQLEIIRRVDALFALADTVEDQVSAATLRADRLTQSILAKAFRGELVPTEAELARIDGREYESASALLERIRSERDAAAAPKSAPPRILSNRAPARVEGS
jgi:type I restriction enzyme, S subunit